MNTNTRQIELLQRLRHRARQATAEELRDLRVLIVEDGHEIQGLDDDLWTTFRDGGVWWALSRENGDLLECGNEPLRVARHLTDLGFSDA